MTRELSVAEAQAEMRSIYRRASIGLFVSGIVWLTAAASSQWISVGWGIAVMLGLGFFIYPLTQLALVVMGGPASVPRDNPLRDLSVQVPLVGPMMLPLVGAAALYRVEWFFPAMMLAMGAHYLPFAHLYGMKVFLAIAVLMAGGGVGVALWVPELAAPAAAATGALLVAFGAFESRARARL